METLTRSGAGVVVRPAEPASREFADRLRRLVDEYRWRPRGRRSTWT